MQAEKKEKFVPVKVIGRRIFFKNRGRNMAAVLAVVMTTMMFTTLFTLAQSMYENLVRMTFRQTGYDAQVSFKEIEPVQAQKLAGHPKVREVGESIVLGLAENKELAGRQVEIRWGSDGYAGHSFALPTVGRLPQAMDEAALDTITLKRLGISPQLGERVTLVWRKDLSDPDSETVQSVFTLCGIWEGNASGYASMAWVGREYADKMTGDRFNAEGQILGRYMAQVSLYDDRNIENTMQQVLKDTGLDGLEYGVNLAYSPEMGAAALQQTLPMYLGMALVFVAGYLIIYNIFQISVTADVQFYGKLKTLGMTGRQLKRLVYGQSVRLCVVGIPIGLAFGWIWGVVLTPAFTGILGDDNRTSLSPAIFIGSAVFAWGTVLVSCLRPARLAGRVSPMEALRTSGVDEKSKLACAIAGAPLRMKAGCYALTRFRNRRRYSQSGLSPYLLIPACPPDIRASVQASLPICPAAGRGFHSKTRHGRKGVSLWTMAWANLGRNKRRTATVICSLSLGLVLLSCFYAKNAAFDMEKYLAELTVADFAMEDVTSADYIGGYDPQGKTLGSDLVERLESFAGVEAVGHEYSHQFVWQMDGQTVGNMKHFYTQERLDDWGSYEPEGPIAFRNAVDKREMSAVVYGMDGIALEAAAQEKYLLEGSFDAEAFAGGNYVLAVGPATEPGRYDILPAPAVGSVIELEGREYTVMAVVSPLTPLDGGAAEKGAACAMEMHFIIPAKTFCSLWPENTLRKLFVNVEDGYVSQMQDWLEEYTGNVDGSLPVKSRKTMAEQYEAERRSTAVMGNAVSMVIALVGVLNFINSMVTAIVSCRREFAMMQSVGMTKKQLCRLLVYEGLGYAAITLALSYLISFLAVGVGVRAMTEGGFTTFHFTLLPLEICTPILLAFAVLVPFFSFKNLEKQSVVERLRME